MRAQTLRRIEDYLEVHSGVIRTAGFQRSGLHNSFLADLVNDGKIVRIKPGLYIAAEAQTVSGFFEVQLALSGAVICLASALAYYELSTFEPPTVHVAVPRGDRTRPPLFPPTKRYWFDTTRYEMGVETVEIEGRHTRIYDREKTICDVIRYRRALGQDVVNETVRNYLHSANSNVDRILEYARCLRQEGPVRTHLEISA